MGFHDAFAVQRLRVLALLEARQGAGATTAEISDPAVGGHEGPRRARQLREMGHPIMVAPLGNGWWKYWLAQPGEVPPQLDLFVDGAWGD